MTSHGGSFGGRGGRLKVTAWDPIQLEYQPFENDCPNVTGNSGTQRGKVGCGLYAKHAELVLHRPADAPDLSDGPNREEAPAQVFIMEVDDASLAAAPGLSRPAAAELVEALGGQFRAKYGWTDVARFSNLGIPAVNLGSGDPGFAHKPDEQCPISQITQVSDALTSYLTR